ncbi:hypothetical protein [Mucisphaera sp.]|uniref:hypothetical protein n=1 Tax=Mucisphaera sp. TaxID=2913024 RepID=UPI003D0CA0A6
MLRGLIAMVLAGVAGAAMWGGIAYATGYEAAIIAWLIGLLVGGVTAYAAGGSANAVTGLLAMVVTAISIAGGKYAVVEIYLQDELATMEANGGFMVQM